MTKMPSLPPPPLPLLPPAPASSTVLLHTSSLSLSARSLSSPPSRARPASGAGRQVRGRRRLLPRLRRSLPPSLCRLLARAAAAGEQVWSWGATWQACLLL